jgi:hypothetical protein
MQLRYARLCLNCEEIHSAAHCPICTSESFAYVSRWIPPGERRQQPRRTQPATGTGAPQGPGRMRWVKRGAAGMAVLAATRLLWQLSRPVEWSADTAASLERDRDTDERAPDA